MRKKALALFVAVVAVVDLSAQQTDSLLGGRVYNIEDVVVTGTRNQTDIRHLPMTVSIVGRNSIEQSLQPSLLPAISEQVPGLFVTSRGVMGYGVSDGAAGGLSLRGVGGGAASRMLVLIDGHPQYMGLMGHPIADAYHSFIAEQVEVLRGPASVLYGSNAMGGVINIVTRKQHEDGVKSNLSLGYGSYNTLQSEVTNTVRKGRFSSMVTGSYNRSDGHRADMVFEQVAGYAKLGYRLSERWKASGDVNITHFESSNPGEVSNPLFDNDSRITRGMASLSLENDYETTSGGASLFCNWGRHWINDGYSAGEEPLDYRFNSRDDMIGVSIYQSARLFAGNRLTVGADYFRFGGESWNATLDGERKPLVDKSQEELATYVDVRQHLTPWLTMDAGVRYDRHSHVGAEWVPQAGVSVHLPSEMEIKLMASKGFRYPTIRELYMFRPANPDLKPESMWNYELSFSQRLSGGRFTYGINVFHIDGKNLIVKSQVNGRPLNINTGEIENSGIEAQMSARVSKAWAVDANYSLLHMKNPVIASPEHKLHVGATFDGDGFSISSGVQYVGGLYTQVKSGGSGENIQENFVMWNMSGRVSVSERASLWLRGENLLARKYEINAGFPMPRATVMLGINITM